MMHAIQTSITALGSGVLAHFHMWDGWAAFIAAALFGYRRGSLWMPLIVAVIINPAPYGLVSGIIHGRAIGLQATLSFTLARIIIAYLGFAIGRLAARLR